MTKMSLTPVVYDTESFKHWFLVCAVAVDQPESTIVIHSDQPDFIERLQELFLSDPNRIFFGFNNSRYDDFLVSAALSGATAEELNNLSRWIVEEKKTPWEHHLCRYQKRKFLSADLKSDLPLDLSLKKAEANLGLSVVESSVPFDLARELTEDEKREVIRYCLYDVRSTLDLYRLRKEDYLLPKALVGAMYCIPEQVALRLTNSGLAAKVLGAVAEKRVDERDFVPPSCIDFSKVPELCKAFYRQVYNFGFCAFHVYPRYRSMQSTPA